jgi:histone H3/H4
MSAAMARQGGRVQVEQSDMRLALNMAKMPKGGISRAAIEETQQLIKKPRAEVREEQKRGVEFPGHNKVQAGIERHPGMVRENQIDGCLPCQNGTAKHPETI